MNLFESLSSSQKIRAALNRDVRTICTETCHFLGLTMSKPATDIVAELLYRKILLYGSDLEAFARHAKRTTVNSEDVKLLARRNSSLKEHISSISNSSGSKDKRRKTAANVEAKENAEKRKPVESPKISEAIKDTDKITEAEYVKLTEDMPKAGEKSNAENVDDQVIVNHNEDELEDMVDVIDLTFD